MFSFFKKNDLLEQELLAERDNNAELSAKFDAIKRSMAVIEFTPDGNIVIANQNFLDTVGYQLNNIVGKHHSIFCTEEYSNSQEYKQFWQTLNSGQFLSGQFERINSNGETIWLEASYNPVYDANKKLVKVIKFASNITPQINKAQYQESLINAVSRSMALIEFNLDGEILKANENFLATTHYSLDQIKGKHHQMFCTKEEASSAAYKQFWRDLNKGEFFSGQFKRVDARGNTIWLEASYNPVYDVKGNLCKVVKFATDITQRVNGINHAKEVVYDTSVVANNSAKSGVKVVENTITLMDKLSVTMKDASENLEALTKQSDQINNIVNTISGIADQTNLLALNAAIEAARAGEQGRGFAVVADEVRQLAGRTSESTTEIANVVKQNVDLSQVASTAMESSISQVSSGVDLVSNLNEVINEINSAVASIVETVNESNQET